MSNIGKKVKILKYGGKSNWDKIGTIIEEHSTFFQVKVEDSGVIVTPNKPDGRDPQCEWVYEQQPLPIFN